MADAITNTSPLLYLHRIDAVEWLKLLFGSVWVPAAVASELMEGSRKGHDVPDPENLPWLDVVEPKIVPSEWLSLDLGAGELAAMTLALEYPSRVVLLDDALARRTAQAAGLTVRGTLGILLDARSHGLVDSVRPWISRLKQAGMWVSEDVSQRILAMAGENEPPARQ